MKKLYRSKEKRMITGVCGGLSDYCNLDVTVIRLLVVVISICTAVLGGLLIYFIASLIIPEEPDYYDV